MYHILYILYSFSYFCIINMIFFPNGKLKFHDMFLNDKQQKNAECNKYITN